MTRYRLSSLKRKKRNLDHEYRMRRTLKDYPKVYIASANGIQRGVGQGLFAGKSLERNEVVFFARGKTIALVVDTKKASMSYPNAIGLSKQRWLDPASSNPLPYLNHSCDPNLGIRGARTFVALRDIDKDEHLTLDYSITECDPLWTLEKKCVCGTKLCRGTIRSIQFLPKHIFKKYLPNIPTKFKQIYEKEHTM